MAGRNEIAMEFTVNGNDLEAAHSHIRRYDDHIFDDDGRPKRTGTVWTASAHIITAVIGSGVLSLAWAMAQLGWIAGPITLVCFSLITFYTSTLLANCYRTGDSLTGNRNYTYMDAVCSILGKRQVWLCALCQYFNFFGISIGYTITASSAAADIHKTNCIHKNGHGADCKVSDSLYMIVFGILQIFVSQLPNFHKLWFISALAAIMSFAYSGISVGLSIAHLISGNAGETTLTGTEIGVDVSSSQKIWMALQALGNVAFAYSYALVLIEIQDTLKSPPAENKAMKKASFFGVTTTTTFYMLNGLLGYAAFGVHAPGNILSGFYEPWWLVDFANACIVVHLVGAYQLFCQPLYAAAESQAAKIFPNQAFITDSKTLKIGEKFSIKLNLFRVVWRSIFVCVATLLAILMPFFNSILGFLGAIAFWPLTVYFPVEMYIKSKQIPVMSRKWISLQSLSLVCFLISLGAACASIEGVIESLKTYTPFESTH